MKIEKIKINNFYSIRNIELHLGEYEGLTIIKGTNKDAKGSNGSGKSAIVRAINMALSNDWHKSWLRKNESKTTGCGGNYNKG